MTFECPAAGCYRTFTFLNARDDHLRQSSKHNWCFDCWRDFATPESLDLHLKYKHGFCPDCDTNTGGKEQLERHDIRTHGYCSECDEFFGSYPELKEHWLSYGVRARHFSCPKNGCMERFSSPANLHAHLKSSKHITPNVKCPFCYDEDDDQRFLSYSAVASHIDANGCIISRRKFNELAFECDTRMSVIDAKETLEDNISPMVITVILDAAKRDGKNVCLYPDCSRVFRSLAGLQGHLQSPVHEADLYRCPECDERFKGMSGVYQHINSLVTCDVDHVALERKMKGIMDRVKVKFDRD